MIFREFGVSWWNVLVGILNIVFQVFIALGIYNDASARGIKKKKTYGVLAFFFPILMVIIYLCTRKNARKIQPKVCNQCGLHVDTSVKICPNCLNNQFTDYIIAGNEKYKAKAKIFLIIALVLYCASVGTNIVGSRFFNDSGFKNFGYHYSQDKDEKQYDEHDSISDFIEDFEKQFEGLE